MENTSKIIQNYTLKNYILESVKDDDEKSKDIVIPYGMWFLL